MFLVCGEALFDVFIGSEDDQALHLDARLGGSPYNVAVGLARLAQPVAFFGGLSTDMLGERLARALAREGVNTTLAPRFDAPTTLGLIELGEAGVPRYAFYGNGAADRLPDTAHLPTLPVSIRSIHLGSFATVVEPVATALEALVRREREGRLVAYDPNVRLNVEPSLARWRERVETLAALAHLVKISDEDAGLLYGDAGDDALARRWLDAGASLVVMTRGGKGATAWNSRGRVDVDAPRVTVVDTVGAGDTFQAAMLAHLAERDALHPERLAHLPSGDLRDLLQFAACAAAMTCSRRGADLPRRHELPPP
ncbi:carbohydrate kinase [Azoarcus sp. L1K30]|uniref:carbohydrate kinase family protein n=1 Tax=Azoarcus sp. L1K30 TaxID=2820277 RepID=UPI001B832771|nr:carbohydrate kinase [Azoarcus sp. L1K30]MBR0568717.1 carbohydrate kinase [Azoarcus sp. L1K30]